MRFCSHWALLVAYYAKLGLQLVEDENGVPVRFEVVEDATEQQIRLRRAWQGMRAVSG